MNLGEGGKDDAPELMLATLIKVTAERDKMRAALEKIVATEPPFRKPRQPDAPTWELRDIAREALQLAPLTSEEGK